MFNNLNPTTYVVSLLMLLSLLEILIEKYYKKIYEEKQKGRILEKDILFIKKKLEDFHPERVNYYLNKYYKKVGYNPVSVIIKYVILNTFSFFVFIKLLAPPKHVFEANPNIFLISNIYSKLNLSFKNKQSIILVFFVALLSLVSGSVKKIKKSKSLNLDNEIKLKDEIKFKDVLLSLFITFILYYIFNFSKMLITVLLVKNIVSIIYNLIDIKNLSKSSQNEFLEDFNPSEKVNVWELVNEAKRRE